MMDFDGQKLGLLVMGLGLLMVLAGAAVYVLGRWLPLGGLPGDLSGGSGNVRWFLPVGSALLVSLVLSVVLTVVLNLVIRR